MHNNYRRKKTARGDADGVRRGREFGIWNLEFITTHNAKVPRVLLTKDRGPSLLRVPVFVPVRGGREGEGGRERRAHHAAHSHTHTRASGEYARVHKAHTPDVSSTLEEAATLYS